MKLRPGSEVASLPATLHLPELVHYAEQLVPWDPDAGDWSGKLMALYTNKKRALKFSDLGRVVYDLTQPEKPLGFFSAMLITVPDMEYLWSSTSNQEYWNRARGLPSLCERCIDRSLRKHDLYVYVNHCVWDPATYGQGEAFIRAQSNYIFRWFAGHEPVGIIYNVSRPYVRYSLHSNDSFTAERLEEKVLEHDLMLHRIRFPVATDSPGLLKELQLLQYTSRDQNGNPEPGCNYFSKSQRKCDAKRPLGIRAWFATEGDGVAVRHLMGWKPSKSNGNLRYHYPSALHNALTDFKLGYVDTLLELSPWTEHDSGTSSNDRLLNLLYSKPHLLLTPSMDRSCTCGKGNA